LQFDENGIAVCNETAQEYKLHAGEVKRIK